MNDERDFASYVQAELQHVPPLRPGALQDAFEQVAVDSQHRPHNLGAQSPTWRFQSMFSATKFVVAGVIVALFGGFLLAGVLTQQPSEESVPAAATSGPGTFSPAGSLAQGRFDHTATRLSDGRILIVGGHGDDWDHYLGPTEIWDPVAASFEPAGSLARARVSHSATLLADGRVLVAGGRGADDLNYALASAEIWDPATDTFDSTGTLADARERHTATLLLDGRVLIVGGHSYEDEALAPASAEIWDPATGSFSVAGSLAEPRSNHTATLLPDGRVLIVGGSYAPGVEPKSVEVWDPATGSFSQAGSLTQARRSHTATLLPDGRVLIVGGALHQEHKPAFALAEIWDPTTDMFGSAGSLGEARQQHTATLLPDGRVLVVGGVGDGERTLRPASAEIWDPVAESFSPAGTLAEPRSYHTATLQPDGRVLIVGGWLHDGLRPMTSALFWEPGDGQPEADIADDSTTPDLLPGVDLVTEEVAPGVYRVLDDGAGHDLGASATAVAPTGSVWMATQYRLFELGQPGDRRRQGRGSLAFAEDGTLWTAGFYTPSFVRSYDGETWTRHGGIRPESGSKPDPDWPADYVADFAVHPDGTVWQIVGANGDDPHESLRHLGPDGWSSDAIDALAMEPSGPDCADLAGESRLLITSDGTMWISVGGSLSVHLDGDEWQIARPLGPDVDHCVMSVGASRDGVLWAEVQTFEGQPRLGDGRHLARFDGREWEVFSTGPTTDLPARPDGSYRGPSEIQAVGPDGTVWLTDDFPESDPGLGRFPVSFDGERWNRYPELTEHWARDPLNESLRRPGVSNIVIEQDGTAWVAVQAGDERGNNAGLYVITPEAVAATE